MKASRSAKKPTTESSEGTAGAGPSDLDLPVDGGIRLELPGFEGPLDLLLHLIQEHELDILNIPVAFITQKYLEYIRLMEVLNIDIASEYLVMAATLAHIKSRMLLPTPPADQEDGEEEELDPRAELIRRLLEYQKYKRAGQELAARSVLGRDVFVRGALPTADPTTAPLAPVESFKLLEAFQRVLTRAKIVVDHQIEFERFSLSDRINQLVDLLKNRGRINFDELFEGQRTRADLIVTFLALLELTRLRMTRLFQEGSLAPILVELAVNDDEAPATTEGAEPSPSAASPASASEDLSSASSSLETATAPAAATQDPGDDEDDEDDEDESDDEGDEDDEDESDDDDDDDDDESDDDDDESDESDDESDNGSDEDDESDDESDNGSDTSELEAHDEPMAPVAVEVDERTELDSDRDGSELDANEEPVAAGDADACDEGLEDPMALPEPQVSGSGGAADEPNIVRDETATQEEPADDSAGSEAEALSELSPASETREFEESAVVPSELVQDDDPERTDANATSAPEQVEPCGGRLPDVETAATEDPVAPSAHSELGQKT